MRLEDKRGNNEARKRRKEWMLETFGAVYHGVLAPCAWCSRLLTMREVEADRVQPGGTYRRENIIPACGLCNKRRSNKSVFEFLPLCDSPEFATVFLIRHGVLKT